MASLLCIILGHDQVRHFNTLHPTLHNKEKVQEWEDFLVVTVTERLELVSTFTPSKLSLS